MHEDPGAAAGFTSPFQDIDAAVQYPLIEFLANTGLLGGFSSTSYSENIALIGLTRVASRYVAGETLDGATVVVRDGKMIGTFIADQEHP